MARIKTGPKVVLIAVVIAGLLYSANKFGVFDKFIEQSQQQTELVSTQSQSNVQSPHQSELVSTQSQTVAVQQKPLENPVVQSTPQVETPVVQQSVRSDRGLDALMKNANKK